VEGKMRRILICEDERDTQESLKRLLQRKDYEVFGVYDGKDAIDKAKELYPDLILLDIRMPKIDGLEVAREIRKTNKTAKIIIVTAFASPQIEQEASRYDISDYIVKPAAPEDIVRVVEQALK
jgi:two-component system response regulator VicR